MAPAKLGIVDDVVVQQRRRVDHLDDRRQRVPIGALVPAGARGEQDQRRPQALASPADDVLGDLADQCDVRTEALPEDAVDLGHLGREQGLEVFGGHVAVRGGGGGSRRVAAGSGAANAKAREKADCNRPVRPAVRVARPPVSARFQGL